MPVLIPLRRIVHHCNPYANSPWGVKVQRSDVRKAIREQRFVSHLDTGDHAGRIAFLVENPSSDAIEVDVGVPSLGYHSPWMVTDGNHRLAAAIFRGDLSIEASVAGELAYARRRFGIDCAEPQ